MVYPVVDAMKQLASALETTFSKYHRVIDLTSSFKFRIFCFVLGSLPTLVLSLDICNSSFASSPCTSALAQAYMLKVSVSITRRSSYSSADITYQPFWQHPPLLERSHEA